MLNNCRIKIITKQWGPKRKYKPHSNQWERTEHIINMSIWKKKKELKIQKKALKMKGVIYLEIILNWYCALQVFKMIQQSQYKPKFLR